MKTLKQVYEKDLTNNQKGDLIKGLAQRYEKSTQVARRAIVTGRLLLFTDDIQYMYTYHAIGFDMKKGFFIDYDRLKEINQDGGVQMSIIDNFGLSK